MHEARHHRVSIRLVSALAPINLALKINVRTEGRTGMVKRSNTILASNVQIFMEAFTADELRADATRPFQYGFIAVKDPALPVSLVDLQAMMDVCPTRSNITAEMAAAVPKLPALIQHEIALVGDRPCSALGV